MGGRGREGAAYSPPCRAVSMTLTHSHSAAVLTITGRAALTATTTATNATLRLVSEI